MAQNETVTYFNLDHNQMSLKFSDNVTEKCKKNRLINNNDINITKLQRQARSLVHDKGFYYSMLKE